MNGVVYGHTVLLLLKTEVMAAPMEQKIWANLLPDNHYKLVVGEIRKVSALWMASHYVPMWLFLSVWKKKKREMELCVVCFN